MHRNDHVLDTSNNDEDYSSLFPQLLVLCSKPTLAIDATKGTRKSLERLETVSASSNTSNCTTAYKNRQKKFVSLEFFLHFLN